MHDFDITEIEGVFRFLNYLWVSETLDFKFLLKPKDSNAPCFVEEGPSRLLVGGALEEDARLALFRLESGEVLEYQVFVKADRVSPFDLAASWRAYQDNFRPSSVRWIPDVSINSAPQTGGEVKKAKQSFLEPSFYFVIHCFTEC